MITSGVITLARGKRLFAFRDRGSVDPSKWRLSGWSEVLVGAGSLFLAAGLNAPLRLMLLLFALFFVCQTASIVLVYRARPPREPRAVSPRPGSFRELRWWWYDAPVERDWLFWAMVMLTVGNFVVMLFAEGQFGLSLLVLFPGCLVCALRNWYRGPREPRGVAAGR